jgi:hypothetical protein
MATPVRNSRAVSALLKRAGLPKSGPYSVWGYRGEGFIVRDHERGALILSSEDKRQKPITIQRAHDLLLEAGYTVTIERDRTGQPRSVIVTWSAP